MLIEQEALLNDGAALVLFHIFFQGIQKSHSGRYEVLEVIVYLIKVVLVSVIVFNPFYFISLHNTIVIH
jgi:NhaP-type Na+/H+ or K+/H+ antiporter